MKQYFENPLFWIIVYIVFAVIFAQEFKKSNRKMKNPNALTILLEMLTALFAILFIPLFDFTLPSEPAIYISLLIVTIIALVIIFFISFPFILHHTRFFHSQHLQEV